MPIPSRGLHESLITESLDAQLRLLDGTLHAEREALHEAEAADRIALHVARVIELGISALEPKQRVAVGAALARHVVNLIASATTSEGIGPERPVEPGAMLRSVRARRPDGTTERIPSPATPLLDTTLLTNAPGEPRIGNQLLTEIPSADRIDLVMAFIRRTGITPLLPTLRAHCEAGRPLRVLTTTYTGSTEVAALDALVQTGADVRVSYDTGSTRLHAKAWLFHRASGFSTAFIGSSNLTHSAQITGLEWNVRASGARNRAVIDKVAAVFDSYWHSGDFVPYDRAEFLERSSQDAPGPEPRLGPTGLRLDPFQDALLEEIELARSRGQHRNLLVAATGTGKTVMAAVDYARLRARLPRSRLLFVAHREEILKQAQTTFQRAVRDGAFGELWVGGARPTRFDHVFASIQSLDANGRAHLDPAHFDVVIVDEFHHAAADSYTRLLDHLRPRELLGLTATPERADGLDVLRWFDGRIAAELRLWDAIDQHRLVPFHYFGVHDGIDLRHIPWHRGRGYAVEALANLYTSNEAWAELVLAQVAARVDTGRMRALGFCVSIDHARFMARVFNERDVAARAIWSDTPAEERAKALTDLAERRINVLFSVDLFNEGVDVPAVDTLLLLRPTDSATLFLQQLGRGLRRHHGKPVCTVLDFVGTHRSEFRFDRRIGALIGGTRKHVERHVEDGFPVLPAGCHMELDAKAREIVLHNIRSAVPARWDGKVEELRRYATAHAGAPLRGFLAATGLELEDLYGADRGWSDLRAAAGLPMLPDGPHESALRRACGRLLHVDDEPRIAAYLTLLDQDRAPDPASLAERERRLLRMLVGSLVDKALAGKPSLYEGARLLWAHPQVISELRELLDTLRDRIAHVPVALPEHVPVPLSVRGRYTRIEILAAFGVGEGAKVQPWQTGVFHAQGARADLLAFTLDKTDGRFSPETRYQDYAISPTLVHWQSQNVTRAGSETGQRYQHHIATGSAVHLFARRTTNERAFTFLGPARYVAHTGELPMSITWELEHRLPGPLFTDFAAAVA
jgi:superfamily II DNA or RNA helicase/HKD family nuclease